MYVRVCCRLRQRAVHAHDARILAQEISGGAERRAGKQDHVGIGTQLRQRGDGLFFNLWRHAARGLRLFEQVRHDLVGQGVLRKIQRAGGFIKHRDVTLRRMQAGYFHDLSLSSVSVNATVNGTQARRALQNLNP
ncbi:hypothetical protein BN133_2770 [Cronobacter dublinensis 582]|nr:hypothetical protein BN133_2770 [Cronobacter dublinensis 582]